MTPPALDRPPLDLLALGPVRLRVRDLDRQLEFYTHRLGLVRLDSGAGRVVLGTTVNRLVELRHDPSARHVTGTTGLYHFALLVPDRPALALVLAQLAVTRTPLTGASDHGVSEALYLSDPEGNGIEVYRDREPAAWPRDAAGRLSMGTQGLDLEALLEEIPAPAVTAPAAMPQGTRMGHVHLHVADLAAARHFYVGVLGFEEQQRYGPSALFVSAGGYHHHVGLNTWQGERAPAPPDDATGLRYFELSLKNEEERLRLLDRLAGEGFPIEPRSADGLEAGAFVRDPSGNSILLSVGEPKRA